MSTTAVMVLNTIARDEFERDWHGFEEPFDFINNPEDPVTELSFDMTFTPEGDYTPQTKTYAFDAASIVKLIQDSLDTARWQVEEEAAEEEERTGLCIGEEELDERTWERMTEFWMDQLVTSEEALVTLDCRLHYLLEGFTEMIAYLNMVSERIPDVRPQIEERMTWVQQQMAGFLEEFTRRFGEEEK